MAYTYEGKIYTKAGGSPVPVTVQANNATQAKKLIEMRPEFKGWSSAPKKV